MDKDQFLMHQFTTLRQEIAATKTRLFWIVVLGLFGVPMLAYFAQSAQRYVALLVPYLVLAVIIMFLAEQNALMRAGRYIRQHIEPHIGHDPAWETWLESRMDLRLMDRHFSACFVIVFFVYYATTIGVAIRDLWSDMTSDPAGLWWMYAVPITYLIGAIWALSTLLHHWRSATRTSDRT
jgi:hypothetical protein